MNNGYVLITGASGGIGSSTSKYLAELEYPLILVDILLVDKSQYPGTTLIYSADISVQEEVEDLFADLKKKGIKLRSIVHLASVTRDRTLKNMSREEWDLVINVNLNSTFFILKEAAEYMDDFDTDKSIILTGSTSARAGNFGQLNYVASKAATEAMSKTAAKELAKYNIRVNCIIPGFIDTAMTAKIPEKRKAQLISRIPMRRMGGPDEVGRVIEFLISDKSSYVTGTSIEIHGGLL